MNHVIRVIGMLFMLIGLSFALETAVTASGKKILLHNDGTWEPFDPKRHLEGADLRDPQRPVEIVLKYKDYGYCVKEKKMLLEADELSASAINDSLKKVPKGGVVIVQTPTSMIDPKDPHSYQYTVKDAKGKVMLQKNGSEKDAVAADELGLSNLIELGIPSAPKGELMIEIKDRVSGMVYEYSIPTKEE